MFEAEVAIAGESSKQGFGDDVGVDVADHDCARRYIEDLVKLSGVATDLPGLEINGSHGECRTRARAFPSR